MEDVMNVEGMQSEETVGEMIDRCEEDIIDSPRTEGRFVKGAVPMAEEENMRIASSVAFKEKCYKAEWNNKIKELDELLEKPEADSASRKQTEAFLLEEFRAMYVRLLHTAESWMRNHYFGDEDRSLWDMFLEDHPEMA